MRGAYVISAGRCGRYRFRPRGGLYLQMWVKKTAVMCAASLFLTADMFKHYKDKANIYKYKLFCRKNFLFFVFFFGYGFYLYIYTRVNAGGWWRSPGAGCSSANWRRAWRAFQFLEGCRGGSVQMCRASDVCRCADICGCARLDVWMRGDSQMCENSQMCVDV